MADRIVFERPDDPYTTTVWRDDDGNIHIEVSAHILADGDPAEVQAETRRRTEFLRESMSQFLNPPRARRPGGE